MYAKPRLADPVRAAAVRAVVVAAVTLVLLMVAFFCSMAGVWLAFPMALATIGGTVLATWAVLDVWITRQVWVQRHGVVSEPSSAARRRATEAHRRPGREKSPATDGDEPEAPHGSQPPGRPGGADGPGAFGRPAGTPGAGHRESTDGAGERQDSERRDVRPAGSVSRPARPADGAEREHQGVHRPVPPPAPRVTARPPRPTAPGRGGGTSVSR